MPGLFFLKFFIIPVDKLYYMPYSIISETVNCKKEGK